MPSRLTASFLLLPFVFAPPENRASEDQGLLRTAPWVRSDAGTTSVIHEIHGSGDRQNPLRRQLETPFTGDELFVRYRIRYDAASLDCPPDDEGEFFVLWLDAVEGGPGSTHSGGIPNLGIHVKEGRANHFMARFASTLESYGPALEGDREYLVVGRLKKTRPGKREPFDQLDLWIDPKPGSLSKPDASRRGVRCLSQVSWVGFSTGLKTEPEDRIQVRDLALATRWEAILGEVAPDLSTRALTIPAPPSYEPPPPPTELAEIDPPPESITTDHWSFQPPGDPHVPTDSRDPEWIRNPIDAFIARKHEETGLRPTPVADAATLVRRMSLLVTGLPPEGDGSPPSDLDAYADALLESPAFGERWGRHWLDVARWAESNGHQHNRDREHAWRYRDWVIDAFNSDKPYDAFLREQIAGDELAPLSPENLIATGFLAAARYSGNEMDKTIQRNDILVDIVNTTSKAFLGLTMECAQCHDHFFDPVTQWDYYRMMAFFAKGQPGNVILEGEGTDLVRQRWGLFESVRSRMIERRRTSGAPEPILVIPKSVPGGMTSIEKQKFTELESALAELPQSWSFYSPITSPHVVDVAPHLMRWPLPIQREALEHFEVRFLDRGDPAAPGPVVSAAWPQVFGPTPAPVVSEHPRLALADWLTHPNHPLTARVWVNRIWQGYFGRGLVESSGDFGEAGASPSHPELLDWLARELVESGWRSKHIHRLILRSQVFRQGSLFSAANADRDPGNTALWRWEPRRLEAEAIRDSALAVAGKLDRRAGGPSVPLAEIEDSRRRSLYLRQKRDHLPHQQQLFDSANAVTSCTKRRVSTVGLQPLWMLNSPFMQSMARSLAGRVEGNSPTENASALVQLALGRPADPAETTEVARLIDSTSIEEAAATILNTNEFLYVP